MKAAPFASLTLALVLFAGPGRAADTVTIIIDQNGQYVEEGVGVQYNVIVHAGQKVVWKNQDGVPHTATSDLKAGAAGGPVDFLFDTGNIAGGASSSPQDFTTAKFDLAKAALGRTSDPADAILPIGYYCARHPDSMGGKIAFYRSAVAAEHARAMRSEMERARKSKAPKTSSEAKPGAQKGAESSQPSDAK